MKKIFTLLTAVIMAVTASAQNDWKATGAVSANDVLVNNDVLKITALQNAPGGDATGTICGFSYEHYFQLRTDNPDPKEDNDYTPGTHANGTALTVEVKTKTDLSVYYRRQKGSNGYDSADNKDLLCVSTTGTAVKSVLKFNDDADTSGDYLVVDGTFSLEPGTYVFYRRGSTMQVYGFSWTVSEGGEEPETPAEPGEGEVTFTVEGSGSGTYGSTYGTYVGAFDYDAKNRELTLKNFLGSNTNVVLKYTLANEGSDPDAIDTNFNSEAVSGLGTDGSIENFADGSFIAQENGKDFMKLTNLKVTTGFYSPMSVTSEGSGTTAKKMLSFTIFVSGDSHRYNEETKEWYAAKYVFADKAWVAGEGVNSVSLKVSIPFDNGTSGIDNVVVDAEDENAPVEYYNLQGVRIAEPAAGQIVIRRQGSKVEKLLVR